MRIEHVALNVREPRAMAQWYVANLDMRIVRSGEEPPYITFLAAADGGAMIELYANPEGEFLAYGGLHALAFHIALAVPDVGAVRERLLGAGATADGEIRTTVKGDQLAIVRDPWGLAIQLVKRAEL